MRILAITLMIAGQFALALPFATTASATPSGSSDGGGCHRTKTVTS